MKKIFQFAIITVGLSLIILSSCKKDKTGSVDPLVGKYIISSAVLSQDLINEGDTILPAGTDLTVAINAALLSSASCSNAADTRLELKSNGQIWYDCEGENSSIQNGTWEINSDRTQMNLYLNIPYGTTEQTVDLLIKNLNESSTGVSGTTTIPLPPEFFAAVGLDLSQSGVAAFQTVMNITITRTP